MSGLALASRIKGVDGPVHFGAILGEGGEGAVYRLVGRSDIAAKVYREPEPERTAKLERLVSLDGEKLRRAAAWPRSLLRDEADNVVGFEMELLDGWVPLFRVYQTGSRLRLLPRSTFTYLVRTARNLATCVHYVHEAGLVIGDLNESNILVDARGMVRIIDVDSFQVGAMSCRVGKGELTPPELQGHSLSERLRTVDSDRFALAVLVFQTLVFGRHPFSGVSTDGIEATLEESIRDGHYAWTQRRQVRIRPPVTLTLDWLPPDVRELFERAFDPCSLERPTALEWHDRLKALEDGTTQCSHQTGHVYWAGVPTCPWCGLEAAWGVSLFSSTRVARRRLPVRYQDADRLWQGVAAVTPPDLIPPPTALNYDETAAPKLKWFERQNHLVGFSIMPILMMSGTLSRDGIFLLTLSWIAIVALSLISVYKLKKAGTPIPKVKDFQELSQDLRVILQEWNALARSGYEDRLEEYRALHHRLLDRESREQALQAEVYCTNRPGEVGAYLSKFSLVASGVLNEKNRPVFASARIKTAADADEFRLASLADLDDLSRKGLTAWRSSLVRHYFSTRHTELTDAEHESVNRRLEADDERLARRLRSAPSELDDLRGRLQIRQRELAAEAQPLLERYEAVAPRFHAYVRANLLKVDKPWTLYVNDPPQSNPLRMTLP